MTQPLGADVSALDQASTWFARLRTRSVSAATLEAYRDWRQQPGNREAYIEVERLWTKAGALHGDAEIAQAVTDALTRSEGARQRRPHPLWGLGLAVAVLTLAGAALLWPRLSASTYATDVGEQRVVVLKDGSRLRLDTNTAVKVRLGARERRIDLVRGQALFEVAHDTTRPFRVMAGQAEVVALGTRFDVRRDGAAVRVTLLQGRVSVVAHNAAGKVLLTPGQQVTAGKALGHPRAVDVQTAVDWTSGRLVFQDTPLPAAIAEVNRYSRTPVVLQAPRAAGVTVSGAFDGGDVDAFVAAMSELHGLRAKSDGQTIILQDAASSSGG